MPGDWTDAVLDLQERLAVGTQLLLSQLPRIIAEPRAYPREAMLLAVIIALVLMLLLLIIFLVIDTVKGAAERRRIGVRLRRPLHPWRWLAALAVLMTLGIVVALMPLVPPVGKLCGSCHAIEGAVASWHADAHASTSCYACHAHSGALGALQASAEGVRSLVREPRYLPPQSTGCLRCHDGVREGVLESNGLRVRHADLIGAGIPCLECHPQVGHAVTSQESSTTIQVVASAPTSERSRMGRCVTCHDGKTADASCDVCHTQNSLDQASAAAVDPRVPTPVTCDGCHSQAVSRACVDCHGLVLPHPGDFMRSHAQLSYADPGLCADCHESASPTDGCGCHQTGPTHGRYDQWYVKHGAFARENWPGGCQCHEPVFCLLCHEAIPQ